MGTRRCSGCTRELPLDAFHKDPSAASGLQSRCRECRRADKRAYRERITAARQGTAPATAVCKKCHRRKRAALFRVDTYNPNGLTSWCTSCLTSTGRPPGPRSPKPRYADARVYELTRRQWARILLQHGGIGGTGARCWACRQWCDEPTLDHLLPLARGGTHSAGNVGPACSACNSSRADRLISEARYSSRYAERRVAQRLRATGRGPRSRDRDGHGPRR